MKENRFFWIKIPSKISTMHQLGQLQKNKVFFQWPGLELSGHIFWEQIEFVPKRPFFLQACATCSKLPSKTTTMCKTETIIFVYLYTYILMYLYYNFYQRTGLVTWF